MKKIWKSENLRLMFSNLWSLRLQRNGAGGSGGLLYAAVSLATRLHYRPNGLAFSPDGSKLYIADSVIGCTAITEYPVDRTTQVRTIITLFIWLYDSCGDCGCDCAVEVVRLGGRARGSAQTRNVTRAGMLCGERECSYRAVQGRLQTWGSCADSDGESSSWSSGPSVYASTHHPLIRCVWPQHRAQTSAPGPRQGQLCVHARHAWLRVGLQPQPREDGQRG